MIGFVFGGAATEVSNWRELFDGGEAKLAGIEPEKTNLENLLTSLLALPAAPRSLYLFTDGWETQGSVERLLPSARGRRHQSLSDAAARRPAIANVAVTKLLRRPRPIAAKV
jgi:hypothetical protein